MKKKVIAVVLLSIMMISLCACGSDEKSSESSSESSSEEKTKVTFQTWNPGEGEATERVIAAFEEKNPDIDIEFTCIPYSDHMQKLKVDLMSGGGPDVFGMQTGASLKEFRDFEMELGSYAEEQYGQDWSSDYKEFAMDLLNEDGEYYALPLGVSYAGFMWADMKYMDKYNLAIPQNYEELVETAKFLREKGEYPVAIGAKDDWINIDTWMSIANDINSEKLYSAIEGETSFEDADLVESFRIWQKCFTDGVFQDGALGVNVFSDVSDLFEKEGSIPMYMNGGWTINCYLRPDPDMQEIFNAEGAEHEGFLMDWNNDGKVCPVTAAADVVLCMNKNTKNEEAAWKWIDFLLHEGQEILINDYLNYFPSRTSMELNVENLSDDGKKNLAYIEEQSVNNVGGYREMPYPELKQSIADNLQALALESVTPEEAAKIVEEASQKQER
ncbi:carbohydrate ABC transporter substrate-binding protein [Faecalicatena contorta]|uniref:ABC transporter substrate-binding protein n=1 Tax=Faecalicatena contorta TaxID=39482 RepID=UPI00129D9879|nr:ABC transporter substrate-binding protein [Faecalicatena contorta]MRM90990.1 carbohydrate ABC transporter substrate-binding protein [Faecalicatena contorta]